MYTLHDSSSSNNVRSMFCVSYNIHKIIVKANLYILSRSQKELGVESY